MNYEITKYTQIIIPIRQKNTKVIEDDNQFIVKCTPLEIIEHSCEYFGSSFVGRKEGTKKMLGISHKPPIIIEESTKLIFFPTNSPESTDCIWINLERIDKYLKVNSKKSEIVFKNGNKIQFNISYGSLSNQILRATRLKFVLDERTNTKINKKSNF
jgi:competence protein ComK